MLKTVTGLLCLSALACADRTVTSWKTTTQVSTKTTTVTATPTAAKYESFTVNYDFDTIQGATGTSLTEIQEYNLLYFTVSAPHPHRPNRPWSTKLPPMYADSTSSCS